MLGCSVTSFEILIRIVEDISVLNFCQPCIFYSLSPLVFPRTTEIPKLIEIFRITFRNIWIMITNTKKTHSKFVIKIGKFEFFISIEFIYYFVETLIITKSRIHEVTLPILRWLRAEQGQNQSTAHKEHIMHAKLRTFERKSFLFFLVQGNKFCTAFKARVEI